MWLLTTDSLLNPVKGATWSFQRIHYAFGYPWEVAMGWPDTETGFNEALRVAGIQPVFIGDDRNFERQTDANIDHVRSFAGSKLYSPSYHPQSQEWMAAAFTGGGERLRTEAERETRNP